MSCMLSPPMPQNQLAYTPWGCSPNWGSPYWSRRRGPRGYCRVQGAQAAGKRKVVFWEQPCLTASPQEGVSSHQTAAAVVLVDARRKRDAQEEMLEAWPPWGRVTTTAWLGKSFSLLLHQRGPGGWRTGDTQCLDPLMPGGARTGEPGGHHGSAPHCAAPMMSPSPHTACMVKRLHAQAPQGPMLSHSDSFIQDDIDPCANTTDPTHGPFAPAPSSMLEWGDAVLPIQQTAGTPAQMQLARRAMDVEPYAGWARAVVSARTAVTAAEPPLCTPPHACQPGGPGPTPLNPSAPCHWKASPIPS